MQFAIVGCLLLISASSNDCLAGEWNRPPSILPRSTIQHRIHSPLAVIPADRITRKPTVTLRRAGNENDINSMTFYRLMPHPFIDRLEAEQLARPAMINDRAAVASHFIQPVAYQEGGLESYNNATDEDLQVPDFAHEEFPIDDESMFESSRFLADSVWDQFKSDAPEFLPGVWQDTKSIVNWHNTAWILGATGVALALRGEADAAVREATAEHPERWGEASHILGTLGEVQWQVPVLALVYTNSIWTDDVKLYDFSKSLISAYTITGVSTVALKGITNTERPSQDWNDGELGFPSFHTSSSFTIAAVIEEYYGVRNAAPFYVLAGVIGWSRIDERDHDLSDVVFGAMLGYIVGKSVASSHLHDDPRVRIRPTYFPLQESYGVSFESSY